MMLTWLLSVIALGAVIALGGSSLVRLAGALGRPRRWLALALMSLSLLLPVAFALRTRPAQPPALIDHVGSTIRQQSPGTAPHHVDTDTVVLIVWAVMSLGLVGVLALSHRRAMAELAGCRHRDILGASVALSPDFGPAAVGLLRPHVVLPEWVLKLPDDDLQLVLRHELEHVRAGDQMLLFAGVMMTVLMPWNASLWWQLRRLRVAMELDCDARVTPLPRDRPRYAQLLLRARSPRRQHRMVLALAPAPSALAERLLALLDRPRPSGGQVTAWAVSALACAVVLTRVPVPSLLPAAAQQTSTSPIVAPMQLTPALPRSLAGSVQRKVGPIRRRPATDTVFRVRTSQPSHPRYDSLVPYAPGAAVAVREMRIGTARGEYMGGGRAGGAGVGVARRIGTDSSQH